MGIVTADHAVALANEDYAGTGAFKVTKVRREQTGHKVLTVTMV